MENNEMKLKRISGDGSMRAARHLANGACAAILGLAAATALLAQPGQRGYNEIYNFGAVVGVSGLIGNGNSLYGTTQEGGSQGVGSVFSLTLPATPGDPWVYTTLYNFGSVPNDGVNPYSVSIGGFSGGLPVLYGTTSGGGTYSRGTVYSVVPPQTAGGEWTEHVLFDFHSFTGATPLAPLTVDLRPGQLPILYGTTGSGGAYTGVNGSDGAGTVFSLTPPTTPGDPWTESVLYSFGPANFAFGGIPNNVVLGHGPGGAPVLYGYDVLGGAFNGGAVFSLAESDGAWTYTDLYDLPESTVISSPTGLTLASNGVLYGTAAPGSGPDEAGQVYSLTPPAAAGGTWAENILYAFGGIFQDGVGPRGVVIGSNGDLYGVTTDGGLGYGTVYSLAPPSSPGGVWTEDIIYRFPFNGATGGPDSLTIGPHGSLYGTTNTIGGNTVSSVFAIEP
jgi:uncharacterized repeat protein (TIGR03803 family)